MISEGIFTRLHARLPRLCDFDTVCDLQARAVKNSEAASKRHAAGLAKEGIAGPDGDDPSDGEDAGDVTGEGVESGQPPMRAEATASIPVAIAATTPATATATATATAATTPAATTSSHKGKEKVGVSGGVSDIPIFNADVPETPLDPASDLALRARSKRPAESASDHSARPPKRASRVVQFVVSSDAEEPAVAETPSTQPAVHEGPAEAENVAAPPSEGVNEQTLPASTSPRPASPAVVMGKPSVSDQPRPSGQSESTDRPGRSKQAGTSASGSGFPTKSLLPDRLKPMKGTCPFLIFRLLRYAPTWLIMIYTSVMAGGMLKTSLVSVLAAEKLSAEESHAQQLAQFRESSDGHLSARLAAEEKLSAAEEEIRSLKELLSSSQESFAARLEAERVAEEAKEKAEQEAADLRNQLSSRDLIFENLKAVLEAESVDRFKRSPAYDALLLREFEKGMRQAKKFFAMKDHSNEKALKRFDRSLQQHMANGMDSIKDQMRRWKAHCHYNKTEPHPTHLEIPSKRAFNTYYSGQKGSFSGSGAEPDLGPVAGRDYEPFMPTEDEEVIWPSDEEIEDKEDSEGPPAAG
ncbi:hypothetical protein LWI29_003133 [Acer saccharum]|uniref:Uncharacterized protein n=1 Tax=Acer saccharum TaxID=4024 RepID=A0AA39SZ21_ACESA|nr:hypothetical protein LWI29_003133 [Acer saccharum]